MKPHRADISDHGGSSAAAGQGEPAWQVALLFPNQGDWSEQEYLDLNATRQVEFSDGYVEVLPMPTLLHQLIVDFLHDLLRRFVRNHATGRVLFAPLPVRLWSGKYREPDIIYLRPERLQNVHGYPHGADLVIEVVSEGEENRRRDLQIKPEEYAKAGILECWLVDPEARRITVLALHGASYREHGVFLPGQTASSALLEGFRVPVSDVFGVAENLDQ